MVRIRAFKRDIMICYSALAGAELITALDNTDVTLRIYTSYGKYDISTVHPRVFNILFDLYEGILSNNTVSWTLSREFKVEYKPHKGVTINGIT